MLLKHKSNIMTTFKKLSARQISTKLMFNNERSEFGHSSDRVDKMEQLEDAALAIDINFDYDVAKEMVTKGADLSDSLSESQVYNY